MHSVPARPSSPTSSQVRAELLRLGYSDLSLGLLITFLCACGLAWATARSGYPTHAWGWLVLMSTLTGLRLGSVYWYRQSAPEPGAVLPWEKGFVGGAWLTGLGWGWAGWSYYPLLDNFERSLLILILCGITAGATRSLSPVLQACWGFQLATLVPLIVRFFLGASPVEVVTGILTCLYIAFVLMIARSFSLTLHRSLQLQLDAGRLVAELQQKSSVTEELNRELTAENQRRRTVEAELRVARDRAEAASQAKSEFLATISHEIRTPMTGILGMLELLRTTALTPAQREQVETSAGSAESLLRILNDILDFSKIETGAMDLEQIPFSPVSLVDDVLTLMRPRASAKSIALRSTAQPGTPLTVLGDATRLRQVLLNLVANAIKFTAHGSVEVSLTATPLPAGRVRLGIVVRDTGVGMDEQTRAGLFQPPNPGDSSSSRRLGGTSLGLAISQRLMHRMGGEILVQSHPGKGSEFVVTLELPGAEPAPDIAQQVLDFTVPDHFNGRILVVEDEKVNQRVIMLMLERLGLSCHVVEDGLTALEVLQQGDWDLVLMDSHLPGLNGYETCRRTHTALGERCPPIVALTASIRPEDREAAREAGMVDFLAKPVRLDTLRTCLARWLPGT